MKCIVEEGVEGALLLFLSHHYLLRILFFCKYDFFCENKLNAYLTSDRVSISHSHHLNHLPSSGHINQMTEQQTCG